MVLGCVLGRLLSLGDDGREYRRHDGPRRGLTDDLRERAANALLGLPDDVLEQFATAYRKPEHESWRAAIERLEMNSRLGGMEEVATTLGGAYLRTC